MASCINAARALVIGPQSGRITVTGNNFSNSFLGQQTRRVGKPDLATGILLQGTRDVTISGNVFAGLAQEAIQADAACRRILVTGNVLVDLNRSVAGDAPQPPGLHAAAGAELESHANLLDRPAGAESP